MRNVKSLLTAAALATALSLPAAAADTPAPAAAPAGPPGALDMAEKSWDAGTVERGGSLNHVFSYKNTGKGDLTVDARPGCGCTVVDFDKVVAPGKQGKITASINTEHFKGPIQKSITVTTNDPAASRFVLEIKANITVPIDVQPMDSISLTAKAGEEKSQDLTLVAMDGHPFDVVSIKDVPGLAARVEPILDAGAKPAKQASPAGVNPIASGAAKYKLTVSTRKDAEVGRAFQTIDVATSHPKVPSLPIHVSLLIQGEVEVTPERVYLQGAMPIPAAEGAATPAPAAAAPPMAQTVKLRKTEGAALVIGGVSSSDPDFATSLKTVQEGHEYDIEIKYTGKPGRGMVSAQVTVKTNEPKQEQIVIPVAART